MVDLAAALAEPARLRLVGHLVQAAVLARHEHAALVGGGDGVDVDVVRGDGVEGVGHQLHAPRHAVVQACGTGKRI